MSDILTKLGVAGKPAVPAVPGNPGTPAIPAFCFDATDTIPLYIQITTCNGVTYNSSGHWAPPGTPGGTIGIGTGPPGWVFIPDSPELNPGAGCSSTLAFAGVQTVVEHICTSATPAVPPTPSRPGQSATPPDFQIGWNSGASSITAQSGDFELSFSIGNVVGAVVGIGPADNGGTYLTIPFGLYFANGNVIPMESGVPVGPGLTAYASTDTFYVVREGGLVSYWQNSTKLYTSAHQSNGAAYALASMYMAADAVNNAAFVSTVTLHANGATCAGKLTQVLTSFATNTTSAYTKTPNPLFKKLTTTSTQVYNATCAAKLTPLLAYFVTGHGFKENCVAQLTKLTGNATGPGIIQPFYAVCSSAIQGLAGFALGPLSGANQCAGKLTKVTGFALAKGAVGAFADRDTISVYGTATTGGTVPNWFIGQLGSGNGVGNATYGLFAQGHQDVDTVYGFFGQLSGYSFTAQGGAQYRGTFQTPYGLTASGTTTILGEAYLKLSGWQQSLMASGTGTQMGRAYLTYGGDYSVFGLGGAQFRGATGGKYVVTASGSAGILGEFRGGIKPHHYIVTASGTQRNFAVVTGTITPVTGHQGGRAIMRGRFSLVASGHQPVTPTYEGYSVTFLGDKEVPELEEFATSHYTDFPFTMLGRFGDAYYGVGPTGIFTMDEDTLPSSAPIVAVVKTGEWDIGEPTLKRARSLWLSGRMDGAFSLDVTSSEIEDDAYSYAYTLSGSRKYRMKVGRGIEATYLAYTISNTDGSDFEIQSLEPEVDILRRSA